MSADRLRDIGQTIRDAMCKLDIDWSRESPAITEAQIGLDEAVASYAEGKASKVEVKRYYKTWVEAHKGGLF